MDRAETWGVSVAAADAPAVNAAIGLESRPEMAAATALAIGRETSPDATDVATASDGENVDDDSDDCNTDDDDHDGVYLDMLDDARSVTCVASSDGADGTVWEWWAVDTQRPLCSRQGVAATREAACAAGRCALAAARPPLAA